MASAKHSFLPSSPLHHLSNGFIFFFILLLAWIGLVIIIDIKAVGYHPVPFPNDYHYWRPSIDVPEKHMHAKDGIEYIGMGLIPEPEDIAWDSSAGVFYTGCSDGWIKRVAISDVARDVKVENWTYVGGRPLGVALGPNQTIAVANPSKGLMIIREKGSAELVTNSAGGVKFNITDGIDVADDGVIYFTDACDKYNLHDDIKCTLDGLPHGRFMSYDPSTKLTTIIASDLYFPNGVSMSPDQESAIVCESMMRRCQRFYISGERKGESEMFVDNLPGFPDNIRYDREGLYWIGLSTERNMLWDIVMKFPFLRKIIVVLSNYMGFPMLDRNAGIMSVDLNGQPVAMYVDPTFEDATGGMRIGDFIYFISILKPYIRRIHVGDETMTILQNDLLLWMSS